MNGARTSAKGVTFNYADPEEGRYIYTPDIVDPVARGNTTLSQSGKMSKTFLILCFQKWLAGRSN